MSITLAAVSDSLSRHLPIYRVRAPVYQQVMLESLRAVWRSQDRRILDVGGGTGVIAQAISDLFPIDSITSVDVEDRYLKTLSVETRTYDGRNLPFEGGAFDCVVINNVIHHVELDDRLALIRECRRVAPNGVILIKDHLAASWLDHVRLAVLDLIGNVPFHGMVKARYLTAADWSKLAAAAGYEIETSTSGRYRGGLFALLFPNRLETTMRWHALSRS